MSKSWGEAVGEFAADLVAQEKSPTTIRSYRKSLELFEAWHRMTLTEPPELDGLTPATLRDWKEHLMKLGMAPQTVNIRLAAMQSFLRFGESQGWNAYIRRPKNVRQETPRPRWLARREQLSVIRAVERGKNKRDLALFALMMGAGLRVAETASVEWSMLELSPRKGQVTVIGKGRKQRIVPLNVDVRDALIALRGSNRMPGMVFRGRAQGPLTINAIGRIVGRYGHTARLEGLTPHVLRHTFCRRLAESGVRLEEIAALAGHESIETTRRYVEPGQEDLRVAVERLAGNDD